MSYQRFLIINPFGIGDVLFTVPLIKNIRANVPDAVISYVANRRTAPLLENLSEINKVIVYDRDEFKAVSDKSRFAYLKLLKDTLAEIRATHSDIAFDLSMTGYASFYCQLAGIKERIGYNYKNRSPFLTRKIPFTGYEGRHVSEYYLNLCKELGFNVQDFSMEVPIKTKDHLWAHDFLQKLGLGERKTIAIFPGGGESWGKDASIKRWPVHKYADLVKKVVEDFKVQVILLGNSKEESLCKEIQSLVKYPIFTACGVTTLGQTMAILAKCSLAVVNDRGPLHLAVASGIKTVSIFGPVDEKVYGPYPSTGHRIVTNPIACRPCYRRFRRAQCAHISCLSGIEIGEVFKVIASSINV